MHCTDKTTALKGVITYPKCEAESTLETFGQVRALTFLKVLSGES